MCLLGMNGFMAKSSLALMIVSSLLFGCKSGDGGGSGESVVEKQIDQAQLKLLLGKYSRAEGDSEYYNVDIDHQRIRCNHSNHSDEYKSHKYAVVRASENSYLLLTADGSMSAKYDAEGKKWSFDASGICGWGIDNPYVQSSANPDSGSPAIAIHPDLRMERGSSAGKLGEAFKLPWGSIKVDKIKKSEWEDDDGETDVLELKVTVHNTSDRFIEFQLPQMLFDEALIEVDCDDGSTSSRGIGNPQYKKHKDPAFMDGGGGWVAARSPIGPGKKRKGWITVLMDDEPEKECVVKFDMAALGGGYITYDKAFGN